MDLTPGEKAVLAQIRVLYYNNSAKREQQVKALLGLWPPTHHEAYRGAFAALVAKQLISDKRSQVFRITDAGLKAMGVAIPQAQPQGRQVVQQRPTRQADSHQAQKQPSNSVSGIRGALSRLGLLRPRI